MGTLFSCCRNKHKHNDIEPDQIVITELVKVDTDGKSRLQYIMNYDSIPYFIPQIKYAKVTDVRQNYTIVVAAPFPNKESPIHRFPVKLKHVCNGNTFNTFPVWESNVHTKAMNALKPLICSNIVELKDIENCNGELWAEVYCAKLNVSQWLIDNNLAVGSNNRCDLIHPS